MNVTFFGPMHLRQALRYDTLAKTGGHTPRTGVHHAPQRTATEERDSVIGLIPFSSASGARYPAMMSGVFTSGVGG